MGKISFGADFGQSHFARIASQEEMIRDSEPLANLGPSLPGRDASAAREMAVLILIWMVKRIGECITIRTKAVN